MEWQVAGVTVMKGIVSTLTLTTTATLQRLQYTMQTKKSNNKLQHTIINSCKNKKHASTSISRECHNAKTTEMKPRSLKGTALDSRHSNYSALFVFLSSYALYEQSWQGPRNPSSADMTWSRAAPSSRGAAKKDPPCARCPKPQVTCLFWWHLMSRIHKRFVHLGESKNIKNNSSYADVSSWS